MTRPVLAAIASAALALPLTVGAATAAPADELPPPVPPAGSLALSPDRSTTKVSASLAGASGEVTAFVELDAPSGVETAQAGGGAAAVEAAAAEVEQLASEVVAQDATARSAAPAPEAVSVTTDVVAGVVVQGDAATVRALADDAGVLSVSLITPKTVTNKGADVFTRALEAWQATGQTGAGVTIGVIDTGVDYTHADFGGPGTPEAYAAAYGADGTGPVPDGLFDPAKFLGGWDFAGPTYDADSDDPAALVPQPDANPIDAPDGTGGGHGSHVAGTAAGYGVLPDGTTFRGDYAALTDLSDWQIGPGTAPLAGVYALKVFGDVGGSTNLTIDALEWAADPNDDGDYNDHLDILNLSLGSDASPADDPENLFIDALADLGTLSVIASGNAGDVTDIGGTPGNARSSLTVANSVGDTQTYDAVEVTAATDPALLGLHAAQNSVNYTGTADVTAPVTFLGDTVSGCTSLADSAAAIAGTIVYLWWDDNDATRECGSATRWNNAQAAGAVGVLIGTELEVFPAGIAGNAGIPGAQLTAQSTDALLPEIQAGTLTVHLGPSLANAAFVTDPSLGDSLNSGSSRGVHGSLGIVKPDVAAPGTLISSASSGSGTDRSTKSGTSMATPHVAGIAALVAAEHPSWGAQAIKAAIMSTATHDVYSQTGQTGPVYGPERVGSGRVDALDATRSEVFAYATEDPDLVSVAFGIVDVGAEPVVIDKTVTVRNTGTVGRTYGTSFEASTTAGGATITTIPARVTVPAGGEALVTVRLTVDPATLAQEIDPTSAPSYDLGIDIPREFVTALSGRLVLAPSGGPGLRIPVHAAPRLVSDLSAQPVAFADEASTTAPLVLTGRGVASGGWLSAVAPFTLVAESPQLEDSEARVSPSVVASGDLRYVGFASTAPQLAAAGQDPAEGTIGIGIAVEGEWASLGTNVVPVILTDIDGDGIQDLQTVVWKYGADYDFTTVETYALEYSAQTGYALGELLDLNPLNGVFADTLTTAFDSNVLVAPINLAAVGIDPGETPTFTVETDSASAPDGSGVVDTVEPFTVDPYAPPFWFDGGAPGSLLFAGQPGTVATVHRDAATGDGRLLLLHTANTTGARAQVVDVTAPVATATTTTLAVEGPLREGSTQTLVATVTPAEATGTVRFLDGTTELGTAPVAGGTARLTVALGVGSHTLTAELVPGGPAFAGSTSAPVTVEVAARYASTITAVAQRTVSHRSPVLVAALVRSAGATPSGVVEVREDGRTLATGRVLASGRTGGALVVVQGLPVGTHHLEVVYTGNSRVAPSSTDRDVRVVGRR